MSLFRAVSAAFKAGRRSGITREMAGELTHAQLKMLAGRKGVSAKGSAAQLRARLFRSEEQAINDALLGGRRDIVRLDPESIAAAKHETLKAEYETMRGINYAKDQMKGLRAGSGTNPAYVRYLTDDAMEATRRELLEESLQGRDMQRRINRKQAMRDQAKREARINDPDLPSYDDFKDKQARDALSKLSWLKNPIRKSVGEARQAFRDHPWLATASAIGAAGWLAPAVVEGASETIRGMSGAQIEEAIREEYQQRKMAVYMQMQQRRLQRATVEHMSRLAQYAPDLYNQALAGRQLPQGAAVFGGTKRPDLVEELAYGMSLGAFQQPTEPDPSMYLMGM